MRARWMPSASRCRRRNGNRNRERIHAIRKCGPFRNTGPAHFLALEYDCGINSDPGVIDEQPAIYHAAVDFAYAAFEKHALGFGDAVDAEIPGKVVQGAQRKDAEGHVRFAQGGGHPADGSVTAARHDNRTAIPDGVGDRLDRAGRALVLPRFISARAQRRHGRMDQGGLATAARPGVEDESVAAQ